MVITTGVSGQRKEHGCKNQIDGKSESWLCHFLKKVTQPLLASVSFSRKWAQWPTLAEVLWALKWHLTLGTTWSVTSLLGVSWWQWPCPCFPRHRHCAKHIINAYCVLVWTPLEQNSAFDFFTVFPKGAFYWCLILGKFLFGLGSSFLIDTTQSSLSGEISER